MRYIIELIGTGRPTYVESYSNTSAAPRGTFSRGQAMPFASKDEAKAWALHYLPSHDYEILVYDAR